MNLDLDLDLDCCSCWWLSWWWYACCCRKSVGDVIIIEGGGFLRGVWSNSLLDFSIVLKPRPMRWIRQPWLPFGTDSLTNKPLIGILPAVFVVSLGWLVPPMEKSVCCEEPHFYDLSVSEFRLRLGCSLLWSLCEWILLLGFFGVLWYLLCDLLFAVGCCPRTTWMEPFPLRSGCSHLWPYCERILHVNSLSRTIPTEFGMLTSLTQL